MRVEMGLLCFRNVFYHCRLAFKKQVLAPEGIKISYLKTLSCGSSAGLNKVRMKSLLANLSFKLLGKNFKYSCHVTDFDSLEKR